MCGRAKGTNKAYVEGGAFGLLVQFHVFVASKNKRLDPAHCDDARPSGLIRENGELADHLTCLPTN